MRLLSITFLITFFLTPFFSYSEDHYDDASFYIEKGKIEIEAGMFDFARENLERAHKLDPKNFEALSLLGDLFLRSKQKQRALDLYLESLAINDNQDMTHVRAGELEDYYGRNNLALEHFLRACTLNPKNSKAFLGASRAFSLRQDIEKADIYFQKSYQLEMTESDLLAKKAADLYNVNKFTASAEMLAKAIDHNGAARDLYFQIAAIERLKGNPKGALAWLEKLAFLRPHDEKVFIELAYTYYSVRSYKNRHIEIEMAATHIERALSINASNPASHALAAEIYETLGNREKSELHRKLSREDKQQIVKPISP